MTQEEILEYNKRCAEFLGAIYAKHAEAWGFGNAKNIGSKMFHGVMYHNVIQAERFEKELKFHSDWNWIMEVCIDIKNIQNPREHSDTTCSTLKREIQSHLGSANKEAVVQAIDSFIKFYNKNLEMSK